MDWFGLESGPTWPPGQEVRVMIYISHCAGTWFGFGNSCTYARYNILPKFYCTQTVKKLWGFKLVTDPVGFSLSNILYFLFALPLINYDSLYFGSSFIRIWFQLLVQLCINHCVLVCHLFSNWPVSQKIFVRLLYMFIFCLFSNSHCQYVFGPKIWIGPIVKGNSSSYPVSGLKKHL